MQNGSIPYIILTGITFVLLFLLFLFMRKKGKTGRLSPLAGIAFVIILSGIYFGEDRNIGYPLIGVGIILAVADIMNKTRKQDIEE